MNLARTITEISLSFVGVAALALSGCGAMTQDVAMARSSVTRFHQELDQQSADSIYNEASPDFQKATTRGDFAQLIAAIHRKLGNVKDATQRGFNVNFEFSGATVVTTYSTKFEQGDADEDFTWKISGAKALLIGYHINSTALILK